MIGEKIFIIEGDWELLAFGKSPFGDRNDFKLTGTVNGKVKGTFSGTDYSLTNNEGVVLVHAHDSIFTVEGEKISMFRQGFAIPKPSGAYDIHLFATFMTGSPKYYWLNYVLATIEGEGSPNKKPNLYLEVYEWKK